MAYKINKDMVRTLYQNMLDKYGPCCGLCANSASFVNPLASDVVMKCLKKGLELNGEKALYNKLSCFERKYE